MIHPVMNTHSLEEVGSEKSLYSLTEESDPKATGVSGNVPRMAGALDRFCLAQRKLVS